MTLSPSPTEGIALVSLPLDGGGLGRGGVEKMMISSTLARFVAGVAIVGAVLCSVGFWADASTSTASSHQALPAEDRALAYLGREVPRWRAENGCYSCHNNGDGARALYVAVGLSRRVPPESLADTTAWLADPGKWDDNPGDPAGSDKGLARIQFAAALVAAVDAGLVDDRAALLQAADRLAKDQKQDGSWRVDAAGSVGSPATYGAALATYLARRTLARADRVRFQAEIDRANRWTLRQEAKTVLDAAAVLLALGEMKPGTADNEQERLLELIRRGQSQEGGWGPYVTAPPEAFDTAVVLLALAGLRENKGVEAMVARGLWFLAATQLPDGSWPETTRPTGSESYAQRLSTTAWATMALLATRRVDARDRN